jgi:hypothetical protein
MKAKRRTGMIDSRKKKLAFKEKEYQTINPTQDLDLKNHEHYTYLAHINNYRIITSNMIGPILVCNFFIRSAISIPGLYVRFVFDAIQIFMKTI